jgi:hypothetical protein
MKSTQSNVVTLPVAPFLIEFRSERLIDLMQSLDDAGFKLTSIAGSQIRYVIDDEQGHDCGRR